MSQDQIAQTVPPVDERLLDVKPHQLEVFCTVAHHLSYVRAAEALYLSQPAVSQQVKTLETTLGVALFARRGRGIALTTAGEALLPRAERLLELLRGTSSVVRQIHTLQRGSVLVGASTSAGAYVVPQLLGVFHRAYPRVHLSLRVANRLTMEEYLLTQQVDLAVMGLITHPAHFTIDFLMRNDLIVVAASSHHLAGRSRIPLRDLQWETFLMREPGSGTRTDIERVFAQAGIALHTRMELGDTGAIKEAVRAGLGIAVVFRQSVAREVAAGELIELNVEAFPLERRWYIAHLRGRRLSRAATALREHLLSHAGS